MKKKISKGGNLKTKLTKPVSKVPDVKVRERHVRIVEHVRSIADESLFGDVVKYEESACLPYNALYLTPARLEAALDVHDKKIAKQAAVQSSKKIDSVEDLKLDPIVDYVPLDLEKRSRSTFGSGYTTAANRGAWLDGRMQELVDRIAVTLNVDAKDVVEIYETAFEALVAACKTYDFATVEIPYLGFFKPRIRQLENYRLRMRYNYDNSLVKTQDGVVDTSYLRRATAINLAIQRHFHERSFHLDPIGYMPEELKKFYLEMRSEETLSVLNQDNFEQTNFNTFPAPKEKHWSVSNFKKRKIDPSKEPIKQRELRRLRAENLKGKVVPNYKKPGTPSAPKSSNDEN